jgi:hypothetical protein
MAQWKNEYYFSGAITRILPLEKYEYKGKVYKRRELYCVNKQRVKGRWIVAEAPFIFKEDAADKLAEFMPTQHVIIKFSLSSQVWYKGTEKEKLMPQNIAWDIMSPRDQFANEKWMAIKNWDSVYDDKDVKGSMPSLQDEYEIKKRPPAKDYKAETFDKRFDYSDGTKEEEEDLPF